MVTTQAQPRKPAAQVTVFSPAKINLYLRILGKRADGYHDLETVMVPLAFGDKLTLYRRKTGRTLDCDRPELPVDDTNLALRAANELDWVVNADQGVKIVLHKQTPLAAGLGGGSSNAAAVLTGLNQLWNLNVRPTQLDEIAARLGSDVNFFLQSGAAVCRGRGEQIEPVPCRLAATVLLVNPGFGISTKWAYQAWASSAAGLTAGAPDVTLLLRALAAGDLEGVSRALYNSLETPSLRKYPLLRLLQDELRAAGASGALMSGSGATVFGLFADAAGAERAAARLREQFGPSLWTQVTQLIAR